MSYCAVTDLDIPLAELIQLCDDNVPFKVLPPMLETAISGGDMTGYAPDYQAATVTALDRIIKAVADAGELIDGYVSGRYQVPLTVVPSLIKTLAVDLAVYKLYMRRKKKSVPDMVQKQYDNALKLLRDIQSGKVVIGATASGATVAGVTASVATFTGSARVSSRLTMEGL